MSKPVFSQINLICGDTDASIAFTAGWNGDSRSGIWRTGSGAHHTSASSGSIDLTVGFDLDSTAFAEVWNTGWKGRTDLRGRLVVGFRVATREAVDDIFRDMTHAGYRGLQEPYEALWGARYAVIEDPDGIAVGLMSPISPDRKSPAPDL